MIKEKNFIDGVFTCLQNFTGVQQCITSAYHPESSGLVEKQNRTKKNALVKELDAHPKSSGISLKVFFLQFINKILAKSTAET